MKMNPLLRLLFRLFIAISALSVFVLRVPTAFACSCVVPGTPQESLGQADAVFAGEVITIDPSGQSLSFQRAFPFIGFTTSSADPVRVTFAVSEVWKGPAQQQIVVTTAENSASCAYSFRPGETYIVYAFNQDADLSTNICTRTAVLA